MGVVPSLVVVVLVVGAACFAYRLLAYLVVSERSVVFGRGLKRRVLSLSGRQRRMAALRMALGVLACLVVLVVFALVLASGGYPV